MVSKQVQKDASFWVQTIDDSATSPADYESMRMMFTMKADEMEREIYVKINDSQRKNQQFKLVLLDEQERTQLEGIDSCTTISILDNANAGVIGFESELIQATPNSQMVKVALKRIDGADGEVSCRVSTSVSHHHGEDRESVTSVTPLESKMVVFGDCQVEAEIEVEIPASTDESVNFIVELADASERAELASKNYCIIEISPEQKDQ